MTLRNGDVREVRQDHFRGGVDEPLTFDDLVRKFRANCAHGGLAAAETERVLEQLTQLLTAPKVDLRPLRRASGRCASIRAVSTLDADPRPLPPMRARWPATML